jgi:Ion channel
LSSLLKVATEVFIIWLFPYPFAQWQFFVQHRASGPKVYNIDQVLTELSLLKIFYVFRLLPHFTALRSHLSRKIYDLNGVPQDNILFLRVLFKEYPLTIFAASLAIFTVVFGFGMQVFERAIALANALGSTSGYDKFSQVANSMWIMILGITTVGYGDITPTTHIARLLVSAGCFTGNIILILMTISIFNMISHNEKEL